MQRALFMPPMTKPLVSFQNAGKIYKNGTVALAGFDLDVREGEFLTLLGPSGCGKSTILRLIAGLDNVTSGTLTRDFEPDHASVGFVFQDPTLMPWASVFENVFLPLRLRGVARRKAAPLVDAVLALVGLASSGRAFPRELSGGMRMRASIARALVLRPLLLLMDEPFAALDEITRFKLNDDLLALRGELGTTIIFVTHSVFESVFLSARIAVLSERPGRVVAEIAIDAPSPRGKDFRTSSVYAHYCAEASQALQRAMDEDLT
jgi:NitT/TauT family transport system ATP-binding protein